MNQGGTLSKFVVGFADRCSYAVLVCKIWLLIQILFFPTHPLRLAGICQLSETLYLIIGKCPCCLSPLPPPWLYARESGCVFYPIGVIPHVAAGSPKTIICLFVSAKLFPDLKILQIFIAEISSP